MNASYQSTETDSLLNRYSTVEADQRDSRRTKFVVALLVVASFAFVSGAMFARRPASVSSKATPFSLELEGKSKKHKKHHHSDDDDDDDDDSASSCADGKYSKRTLQLAYELPFAALFRDHKGRRKFEASSVIVVEDDVYAVCDASWSISKINSQLTPFALSNVLLGDVDREEDDSGYEAIFHDEGTFYVVRESIQHDDKSYHAIIEELELGDKDYDVADQCSTEFEFEGDSKGFEGAISLRDVNNDMIILGLCEGNHCSESRKNDKGNGRVVVMKKMSMFNAETNSTDCSWETVRTIHIPESADFRDYSAITMSDSGRVGISSQEESQLWVGQLLGQVADGWWDVAALEFEQETGTVYDFPKNDNCQTVYCNIEGVNWLNDDMIIAASDKMKSKGKQDFRCFEKDQSVHVFVLPQ